MLLFIGGVLGLLFGAMIVTLVAPLLGFGAVFGAIAAPLAPISALVAPLVAVMTGGGAFVFAFASVFIAVALAYALAAVSLLGVMGTRTAGVPNPLPDVPLELVMRGFHIGLNASLNYAIWAALFGLPAVGMLLGLINFLAVFTALSRNLTYQAVLGWSSWVLPMSWLVMPLGIILFLINLPSALATFGIAALRFDTMTATFETTGGAVVGFLTGLTGFVGGGFNLGNFSFLSPLPGTGPAAIQTLFNVPGLSAHETGHTLQIAGFGGFHGWVNAIDENVPPLGRLALAYGEQIVESHFPRNGLFHVRVWS
ncbi:MAG TPA: hypothetical protein VMN60_08580 [Longimicrobiales bacterium]|nr:hypothetical protein [Longimicrobiales bacterium]